jgi:hypothetical protein
MKGEQIVSGPTWVMGIGTSESLNAAVVMPPADPAPPPPPPLLLPALPAKDGGG